MLSVGCDTVVFLSLADELGDLSHDRAANAASRSFCSSHPLMAMALALPAPAAVMPWALGVTTFPAAHTPGTLV